LSAVNLNKMDEGIDVNRKAILELQSAVFSDGNTMTYNVEKIVETRGELPNAPKNGAYYYVSDTNTIYQVVDGHYKVVESKIKQIYGGGAQ
jgi:hypothetical protein